MLEVTESSYNYRDVYQQLIAMLRQKPEKTLLFALKERWLLEFVPALEADGYFAADQLAYTGFADTQAARRLTPKMQLISQNPFLMGAFAAELLVNRLKDPKQPAQRVVIPAKFN